MSDENRSLLILYATETGNAQDAAEQVAHEAHRRCFSTTIASTDEYPLASLVHDHLIIFVVSTTGSGMEPRSMTDLWTLLLRSDLPTDLFECHNFAVFGLGDTAYEKFCWAAKKLSRRMESLGAREVYARGEGDDQHPMGTDGALEPWITGVFGVLEDMYPLPAGVTVLEANSLPPPRIIIQDEEAVDNTFIKDPSIDKRVYHDAKTRRNHRMTSRDWFQDVRHIEFDFDLDLRYKPGDVAVIHPTAAPDDVDSFLAYMGWANAADQPFRFSSLPQNLPVPQHIPRIISLRQLFMRYLDVNAVPRRTFFKLLRHFVSDELEREKLDDFCSVEGADDLYEYCYRVRRTIREVMSEFRSADVPREYVFDLFPVLRPRQFSIASSAKVFPKQVHICVAIVQYKTKLKVPRRGVCTTYLASLRPGDTLRVGIRKGFLSTPKDSSVPVICIGPGTGIAPMRALLSERIFDGSKENTLYFGCRSADNDQHYADQWKDSADSGHLTYRVAISRDGPDGVKRTYVQDLMRQDEGRLWELIYNRIAWVFISGSSNKMPTAVKGAIVDAARNVGGMTDDDANKYLKTLERQGRLFEECWS